MLAQDIAYMASVGRYNPYGLQIEIEFPKLDIKLRIDIRYDEENNEYLTLGEYVVNSRVLKEIIWNLRSLEGSLVEGFLDE